MGNSGGGTDGSADWDNSNSGWSGWGGTNTDTTDDTGMLDSPLSYQDWISQNPNMDYTGYQSYISNFDFGAGQDTGGDTGTQNDTGTTSTSDTPLDLTAYNASGQTAQVTPGPADPNAPNQINTVDYAGQTSTNPSLGLTTDNPNTPQNESMFMQDQIAGSQMTGTEQGTTLDPNAQYTQNSNISAQTTQGTANTGQMPNATGANTYDAAQIGNQTPQMEAAQGQLSDGAVIGEQDVQLNTDQIAAGQTGTGQALNDAAYQDITYVLDTSNPLEKAMAQSLGRFGYIDSKATVQGQLAKLQEQFVDANGNPKIPAWAAGTARNVAKIATFSGMTGTAATAAMAQAIMEASIPVATQDAQFFQSVTLQNLNNKQEQIINKANVLAKMDMMNLDNRMAAAVQNSKNFLAMDMANLSNDQQAQVLNTQQRFQSLLEDTKQQNAQRLFTAESENDMQKFYEELGTQMEQFNVAQLNGMEQFNANQSNSMNQFNASLESQRDQFYATMGYNVDVANAKWRQTVTLTEDQQSFEAAAVDVQNMLDISQEALNQLWDRSDALLDYIWKSGEAEADRATSIAVAKIRADASTTIAQMQQDFAAEQATGQFWGGLAGIAAESFFSDFDWGGLFS